MTFRIYLTFYCTFRIDGRIFAGIIFYLAKALCVLHV